jgi:hypothetical protein
MAIINTGALAKSLWPGVNKWFGMGYDEYPLEYKELFRSERSEKNFEEDVNSYGLGLAVVKPEGENISYDSMAQGFLKRYVHTTYALGFIVTREQIEDNMYMELAEKRSKRLAFSMRQTKENVGANVFNRAFDGNYAGADGLELCSDAHLLSKGGTYKNELSTAADLSEASLEQACIDIMDFKDDAGLRIQVMPRKLVIPKELCFEAERILKSTLQNDSANNALNALRSKGVLPEGYVVNHYLSDADAFFILTNCPDGMKHFERRDMAIENDTDFDSENMKFKASERYVFGWTDPRGIFGSPGS